MTTAPMRTRLPARRASVTEEIEVDGCSVKATVGFDTAGRPREIFMVAGKEGSAMNMLLADAAVAISVALQFGVPPQALAKSVGRLPMGLVSPSDLDQAGAGGRKSPASLIGAGLDLIANLDPTGPIETPPRGASETVA